MLAGHREQVKASSELSAYGRIPPECVGVQMKWEETGLAVVFLRFRMWRLDSVSSSSSFRKTAADKWTPCQWHPASAFHAVGGWWSPWEEQGSQNLLDYIWGFFNNACENFQRVSSFCGLIYAVFVKGKWTPPSKANMGLESRILGICFSIKSLLPCERILGVVAGRECGGSLIWCGFFL